MPTPRSNKYRSALEILQRGRDRLVEELADQVLDQADDLLESGFLFNEFLENQGTRLHFLSLLVSQLEQSAEQHEEEPREVISACSPGYEEYGEEPPPPPEPPKRKRKSRSKKLAGQASREGEPGET